MKLEPLENERWVWAKTFKNDYSHYLVSDMGRCYNTKYNRFIGTWHNGYWYVCLSKSRKQQELIMVGRLMLISFGIEIPEHLKDLPTNKLKAMHLDGNSNNNSLSNFAWGDDRENQNEENCRIRKSEALKGKQHSEETKKKMSEAKKGLKNHWYGKQHTEETRRKMSEAHKSKYYGKYGKNHTKAKPILQYSKDGELIRLWDCIIDAQRELGIANGHISACARGKRPSAGGYLWKYKEVA